MPWECPRCRTIHNDLQMSCNCPPPCQITTSATFHPGNVEFVGTVPPRTDLEITPSAAHKMLDERIEEVGTLLGEAMTNFGQFWHMFETFAIKHQETDMPELKLLLGNMLEAFDAVSCRVMDLDLLTDMRGDRKAVDDEEDEYYSETGGDS
jgi:hypothetical protein